MDYVHSLTDRGKHVFLDMKYYDIGETVKRAVAVAAKCGATFLTVHAVGQVMRAAIEGRGDSDMKLLAVTVLTSLDNNDLKEMGHNSTVSELVAMRVRQAREIGIDGLVASPLEAVGYSKAGRTRCDPRDTRRPLAWSIAGRSEACRYSCGSYSRRRELSGDWPPGHARSRSCGGSRRNPARTGLTCTTSTSSWLTTVTSALFGMLMLGIVGPLIPDETILIFAGIAVHRGQMNWLPALICAIAGSLCGITLSYLLGKTGVVYAIKHYPWLNRRVGAHLPEAERWFERFGKWTLTFGYFIAGIRHFTALVSGTTGLPPGVFALYAYPGGCVWVACFLAIGYYVGEGWERYAHNLHAAALILAALVTIGGVAWWIWKRDSR